MPAPNVNQTTVVHYDGTDVGRIYLGDVGQRHQLGSGSGLYNIPSGQDRYIRKGQDATFASTGAVIASVVRGKIKHFVDAGSFSVTV